MVWLVLFVIKMSTVILPVVVVVAVVVVVVVVVLQRSFNNKNPVSSQCTTNVKHVFYPATVMLYFWMNHD